MRNTNVRNKCKRPPRSIAFGNKYGTIHFSLYVSDLFNVTKKYGGHRPRDTPPRLARASGPTPLLALLFPRAPNSTVLVLYGRGFPAHAAVAAGWLDPRRWLAGRPDGRSWSRLVGVKVEV